MKIAVPDLISNSYFPVLAAAELGLFRREGLDATVELIAPADNAYRALAAGDVAFVGAEAHAALAVFPHWEGIRLLCAQAQHTYWFLVLRPEIAKERGNLSVLPGCRIGAAPFVEMALRRLLADAGLDLARDRIAIVSLAELLDPKVNTGVALAEALGRGEIDGFWANGTGAAISEQRGVGKVVLDVRRGDGPPSCRDITFAGLAASASTVKHAPDVCAAAVRAIAAAHAALREDSSIAGEIGRRLFPPTQAGLIEQVVRADLPYYATQISRSTANGLNGFARWAGLLDRNVPYEAFVATEMAPFWTAAGDR